MRRWIAVAVGVAGVGLISYALLSGDSDEELIRARLDALEAAVRVDGQENPVFRGARINKEFKELFDPDVAVRIPELTSLSKGRQGLAGVATKAGTYFQSVDVDFQNVDVQIDGSKVGALVMSRARLDAVRGGRPRRDERQVTVRFSKGDDGWRIVGITVAPKGDPDE